MLILTQLDAGSAIAIQKAAAAKGAKSIDYDRQVIGGIGQIYVSFDNHAVGVLQGKGVVAGLKANGKYASTRSWPSSTVARRTATRSSSRAATTRS